MTDSKDKDPQQQSADVPAAGETPAGSKSSGRVAFDPRGNPIWEWQLETGVYSRDVSTQKLKKLDLGDLSIAESAIQQRPPGLGAASGKGSLPTPGEGFNPYDSTRRPDPSANPYEKANRARTPTRPAALKPAGTVAHKRSPPPQKESVLSRLDQWFKGKRRSKDEDYE